MKKSFLITFISAFLALNVAHADIKSTESLNAARWYKVYWSGIHIADLRMEFFDNAIDASIESYGIVKKVSKYRSNFKTTFNFIDGRYIPLSYFTEFELRNGGRTIDIKYTENGKIKQEVVNPPDNRAKRPAVEENSKKNSADPLTALMISRQQIKESLATGKDNFNINMYDGRRLSRLDFTVHGRIKRKINNHTYNVVKVTFKRTPLEGYTNNELTRMKKEEPVFTLYLSDDEYLLPIKADADAPLGTAVILLEKSCATMADCTI